MSPSRHFSRNYAEARQKFHAAAGAGLAVENHEAPAQGPAGETLTTDVVRIGAEGAENLLVTCSATHGVEGFCGSGATVGFLDEAVFAELPAHTAVVLVHAINPHGFAHERRVNEDNVDLNRNFVDHDQPYPTNPGYDRLHPALVPADWDGPARAAADRAIAAYIDGHGRDTYQAVVTRGQYHHADGLFFGGHGPTWSNRVWRGILARHGAGCRRVAFIDFHTGLGPRGYGEIQFEGTAEDPEFLRAQQWYDGEATSPSDGSSSSAAVSGYLGNAVAEALPAAERTCVGLEYGTVPLDDVLGSLRGDNWLYERGTVDSAQGREIKAAIRAAFYGEDDAWKRDIWERAVSVCRRAVAGLSQG